MSGYVASARIDRAPARLAAGRVPPETLTRPGPVAAATVVWIEAPPEERSATRLNLRWAAFRERWSQLTFFLFDPNSWR